MKSIALLFVSTTFLLSACSHSDAPPPLAAKSNNSGLVKMSSQIASYCTSSGGTPTLARHLNGDSSVQCQFANGRRCDSEALLSGQCIAYL